MRTADEINAEIKQVVEGNAELFQTYGKLVSEYMDVANDSRLMLAFPENGGMTAITLNGKRHYAQ